MVEEGRRKDSNVSVAHAFPCLETWRSSRKCKAQLFTDGYNVYDRETRGMLWANDT